MLSHGPTAQGSGPERTPLDQSICEEDQARDRSAVAIPVSWRFDLLGSDGEDQCGPAMGGSPPRERGSSKKQEDPTGGRFDTREERAVEHLTYLSVGLAPISAGQITRIGDCPINIARPEKIQENCGNVDGIDRRRVD